MAKRMMTPPPETELLTNEPAGSAEATLVLAHGAGGGMESHPLNSLAESIAQAGIRVVRFEFPYMYARRNQGRRKPPDSTEVLLQTWHEVIEQLGGGKGLFIGGKSMGGRMASMVADEAGVRGLVCLGYPFHPPGKPQQLRIEHLELLKTPAAIVQGERDLFGTPQEVASYPALKADTYPLDCGWRPLFQAAQRVRPNRTAESRRDCHVRGGVCLGLTPNARAKRLAYALC